MLERTVKRGAKRDPLVFPETKLFEPARGVEQNFGANPAIESDEPPFGETASAGEIAGR